MKRYVLKRTSLLNRTSYNDSASNKFRKKNRAEACSEPCKTSKMELLVRKRRRAPTTIIYIRATQRTFQPGLEKINKIHPENNSLYFRKWNFLTLRLTNFLYFLKKKAFLIFPEMKPCTFRPQPSKFFLKKQFRKNFLYFGKQSLKNFSYFRKWNFLTFSQKRAFLILQEMETPKKFLIFSKKKASLIFRKLETPKKFFKFQEEPTYASGNFLYFRK